MTPHSSTQQISFDSLTITERNFPLLFLAMNLRSQVWILLVSYWQLQLRASDIAKRTGRSVSCSSSDNSHLIQSPLNLLINEKFDGWTGRKQAIEIQRVRYIDIRILMLNLRFSQRWMWNRTIFCDVTPLQSCRISPKFRRYVLTPSSGWNSKESNKSPTKQTFDPGVRRQILLCIACALLVAWFRLQPWRWK
jgi:hypothetical protein